MVDRIQEINKRTEEIRTKELPKAREDAVKAGRTVPLIEAFREEMADRRKSLPDTPEARNALYEQLKPFMDAALVAQREGRNMVTAEGKVNWRAVEQETGKPKP